MMNSIFKSKLHNAAKTAALLSKIKALYLAKPSRLVFEIDGDRFGANEATNVAFDAASLTNTFVFTRPSGPSIKASKVIQSLTYTAVAGGTGGNAIQIEYLDTGVAGAEVASVVGSVVSVSMDSGVSTANQIKAAVMASAPASALVSVALTGANDAEVAAAASNLTGGVNTEAYDVADIRLIKRLRTKKYLIRFKSASDPAAV